ncbi:MAG: zinc-ribbon domain-containing protein [Thermodesulfobacteriota bacterium]|nr:zinc-ribbon domain-containing protein [Thermodesulfobacteriota bacterium]
MENPLRCPRCQSEALYRYGFTPSGKQRYLCVVCQHQFVEHPARKPPEVRPSCPRCGQPMHVYMRRGGVVRFRCTRYPECRTYLKIAAEVSRS